MSVAIIQVGSGLLHMRKGLEDSDGKQAPERLRPQPAALSPLFPSLYSFLQSSYNTNHRSILDQRNSNPDECVRNAELRLYQAAAGQAVRHV